MKPEREVMPSEPDKHPRVVTPPLSARGAVTDEAVSAAFNEMLNWPGGNTNSEAVRAALGAAFPEMVAAIERLREAAKPIAALTLECNRLRAQVAEVVAEIERLKTDYGAMKRLALSYDDENDRLRAQVAELQEALLVLQSHLYNLGAWIRPEVRALLARTEPEVKS